MCLLVRKDDPSSSEMDVLGFFFAGLKHYHLYQETGEVAKGVTVVEEDGVLSFKKDGAFTDDEDDSSCADGA